MNISRVVGTRFEYELRFKSLVFPGRHYSFPCDISGRVDMDMLGERSRNNYLFARAMVGIELACPDVVALTAVARLEPGTCQHELSAR